MNSVDARRSAQYSFVAHRNDSLSRSDRQRAFWFICGASISVAVAFAIAGAWPVLPFAGIEMAVLYAAFRYVDHHASDYEYLAIEGDRVRVEIRDGADVRRFDLNRYWARVVMSEAAGRQRLAVRSHGRELEVGRHLTRGERERLRRELAQQLGTAPGGQA
jgi:uncharacterized membrane protein